MKGLSGNVASIFSAAMTPSYSLQIFLTVVEPGGRGRRGEEGAGRRRKVTVSRVSRAPRHSLTLMCWSYGIEQKYD